MKKDELMYQYAYEEYKQQLIRKKEIRDRSSFLFGLSLPIISTLASASIASGETISCPKLILLIIAGIFVILSLFFFLLIYIPSGQLKHHVGSILNETAELYNSPENEAYLGSLKDDEEKNSEEQRMSYHFFSKLYSDNIDSYEQKHRTFKLFFVALSIFISICYILLTISLGV